MDPLTHIALTYLLIDKQPLTLLASLGPDAPFYLTYPALVLAQGKAGHAIKTGEWPDPPKWIETLHHAFHSLPILLAGASLFRLLTGYWPWLITLTWGMHVLVDIPTHSRKKWGPRFLWPFSNFSVDGVSWVDFALRILRKLSHSKLNET